MKSSDSLRIDRGAACAPPRHRSQSLPGLLLSGLFLLLVALASGAAPALASGTLDIGDAGVAEGNIGSSPASFVVTLSGSPSGPVTVGYSTVGGSATADDDFGSTSGTLTFVATG